MVRAVQQARKDAGLQVSDRIRTTITDTAEVVAAVQENRELVSGETLSVELELLETPDPEQSGITVAVVASAGSEGAL